MKLASFNDGSRDGRLCVISRDLKYAAEAAPIARTLQAALDDWAVVSPRLAVLSDALNAGSADNIFATDFTRFSSPLPRAYQWLDGSAYLSHSTLFRKAQGKELPPHYLQTPLMYQGGSDSFLAPREAIVGLPEWGMDCEAEIAIITNDVRMGAGPEEAMAGILLVTLANDVSLRALQGAERDTGFGWMQCKPSTAFAPVAVTPDELGDMWRDSVLHQPIEVRVNDTLLGRPNAGDDLQFNFGKLIQHATRTRRLSAGTISGSGTISNRDVANTGVACIAERRYLEVIEHGVVKTPFLQPGDRVAIQMLDKAGLSIFGCIDQQVALPSD